MTFLKPKLFFIIFLALILSSYFPLESSPRTSPGSRTKAGPRKYKQIIGNFPGGTSCIIATNELILVAQKDLKQVLVLNPEDGQSLGVLKGHSAPVKVISVSPGNDFAATTDEKGLEIYIWDFKKFELLKSLKRPNQVTALAFGPQGKMLAVGDKDGAVFLLELSTGKEVKSFSITKKEISGILKKPPGKILDLEICPTGRYVAALEKNGSVLVWDLSEKKSANIHIVPPHKLWSIQFSANGRYLLATGGKYSLKLQLSKKKVNATVSNLGGIIFIRDMNDGKTYSVSTKKMIIEDAFFSTDGRKIIFQASTPPVRNGMTKLLYVYPIESILKEEWTGELSKLKLGRGPINQTSIYCPQKSIYCVVFKNKLYSWLIK